MLWNSDENFYEFFQKPFKSRLAREFRISQSFSEQNFTVSSSQVSTYFDCLQYEQVSTLDDSIEQLHSHKSFIFTFTAGDWKCLRQRQHMNNVKSNLRSPKMLILAARPSSRYLNSDEAFDSR